MIAPILAAALVCAAIPGGSSEVAGARRLDRAGRQSGNDARRDGEVDGRSNPIHGRPSGRSNRSPGPTVDRDRIGASVQARSHGSMFSNRPGRIAAKMR
jgi:hypothetical protein